MEVSFELRPGLAFSLTLSGSGPTIMALDLVAKLRSLAGLHPYFGAVVYLFLAAQSKQDWETVKGQVGSLTSEAAIVSPIKSAVP
jgi:hypothetical protein